MLTDIGRGPTYLARGISLVTQKGLRRYAIMPLLINILLFGGLLWWGFDQLNPLVESIVNWLPDFLHFVRWLIWILVTLVASVAVFLIFTPIVNIIAAPFNAIMAEKIEQQLTGQEINSGKSLGQIIKDSMLSQFKKLVYIGIWVLGLSLLSLIPVINFAMPVFWVLFGSWLMTLDYMDYPLGNHDFTFNQQKSLIKTRRSLSLGFGAGVLVITSIPLVNFIAIPVAVAGATVMWVEQFKSNQSLETASQ